MTQALAPVYRLTFADWLSSPEDGLRREIIEGELFVTPPPAIDHQRISRDLGFRIYTWLKRTQAGEVLNAPVGLKLSDEHVFEPDLVVVLHGSKRRSRPR